MTTAIQGSAPFAQLIARRRAELGLTQAQVGSQAGVTGQAVHYWESGTLMPEADRLRPLAAALDLPLSQLQALWFEAKEQPGGTSGNRTFLVWASDLALLAA